jgi:group I intron endonuclease
MLIYRAINKINGKSYIGKTEKSLEVRREWHVQSVRQRSQFAFHRAISKYGTDAFEWQVLDTATDVQDLNQKEQHYITLYESFGSNGYNMTAGGEGQTGWNPSPETRALWSQQRKGKKPWNAGTAMPKQTKSEEEKAATKLAANQKRSEALKGRKTWNTGLAGTYAKTMYKVTYKDGTEKVGTRLDLNLPPQTIGMMFRDKCGSRKYNIMKIERL